MSAVFADTSAFLALLVPTDAAHKRARKAFDQLAKEEAQLVTTSYVLVETYALIGRRLGLKVVKEFRTDFAPLLDVVWIGAEVICALHAVMDEYFAGSRHKIRADQAASAVLGQVQEKW